MTGDNSKPYQRLDGLDVARFLALIGMVIVNFDVVMVVVNSDSVAHESSWLAQALQGRAAATFVVLAGIGLGLGAARAEWSQTLSVTLKRVAFLLVAGLLNTLIFDADIIHYYAFYFLFGTLLIRVSSGLLWLTIVMLVFGFVGMTALLDYEAGWNWQTLTYAGFWTPTGFIRNLFFNGWHPLVPWLAFLLFGIWISRLDLWSRAVQIKLALIGAAVFALTLLGSRWLIANVAGDDPEAAILFATEMVPPMPLYMIAGGSVASIVIGASLLMTASLRSSGLLSIIAPAGRQTLTLYFAHIVIGMGTLEVLGRVGGQTGGAALAAAILFCALATLFAVLWSRRFRRGPLEGLMRRWAG